MRPADSQHILQPPRRGRKVFCFSLAGHFLLAVLPFLLGVLADWLHPRVREELTVNLVDEPSTAPEVAPQTTRLPPSPKPEPKVNPPPVPPKPAPPEPKIADLPVPVPPEPKIADLPMPAPPKKKPVKKPPAEPKIDLPKIVKKPKPAAPPQQDRRLTDSRKVGVRTGERKNPDIPIGAKDTGQKYAPKASDTPDGGKRNDERYAAMLGMFLKSRWSACVPARAQLGDAKPEVTVQLTIAGDGRLLNARIEKPSGNAAMDGAVARLLNELRTQRMPKPADGREQSLRVIFDTRG